MIAVFLTLVNRSIIAGELVLTVILLRLLLKNAPKWLMVPLWGFVAFRLICPFSIESPFSMILNSEPIPVDICESRNSAVNRGLSVFDQTVNPLITGKFHSDPVDGVNPLQIIISVAVILWGIGALLMFLYMVISFIRIRLLTREAVLDTDHIWICDRAPAPFLFGILKPRIYLPSSVRRTDMEYIIAHENAHLKRGDHIWKILGFIILSIYWFHPLLWVAYVLFCRDIEFACDERVLKEQGYDIKKPYAEALIHCSFSPRKITACPLAFGEVCVKKRIERILRYRKPARNTILITGAVLVLTACFLLTNPKSQAEPEGTYTCVTDHDTAVLFLSAENQECSFSCSMLSSFFFTGTYLESGNHIILSSDDGKDTYTFRRKNDQLIFVADKSVAMPAFAYSSGAKQQACVPDGAVFRK